MILRPATWGAVEHVCLNLRDSDVIEVWAVRDDEPDRAGRLELARAVNAAALLSPWAQTAWVEGEDRGERTVEPVAVFVAQPRSPTSVEAVFLATNRWREIARPFTRHALKTIRPALVASGVRRIEARVWAEHRACRWAEALGAKAEASLRGWGKNGESFVQYAWTA